jgi:actin-related protein
MLTEAAMNPKGNRAKMAEIFFEKLGFGHIKIEV